MPHKANLLIVDDEANTLASLARAFRLEGHEATVCDNAAKALDLAKAQNFDLIFSDVVMPGKDGLSLLEDLKSQGVTTPVVMMSGQAHIEMAVRATRLGALDFLEKPISTEKLLLTVENALKLQRLESENVQLRQRLGKHEIIWTGETMRRIMAQVERVAASETRICILGETGTGKELVARTLHEHSPRASGPFIALNCAAVPAELIESELFGHEKGSFTGAASRHLGKFEQAGHGTIFLDEIGDMPLPMQAKLLRVLEEGEVERIGGDRPDSRGCARPGGHASQSGNSGARREIPPGPVSPSLRFPPGAAPAARAAGRHPRADWIFQPPALPAEQLEGHSLQSGGSPGARGSFLAGEHPRTAQCGGTSDAARGRGRGRPGDRARGLASGLARQIRPRLRVQARWRIGFRGSSGKRSWRSSSASNYHITNAAKALGLERSHLYKKAEQLGIDLQALRHEPTSEP